MVRCIVSSCRSKTRTFFNQPENKEMLLKWQKILSTKQKEFAICADHFSKEDLVIKRNLRTSRAVPQLYLSDVNVELEGNCCGVCLDEVSDEVQIELTEELETAFKEISEFSPIAKFLCQNCKLALEKYIEFKSVIKKKHLNIRNEVLRAEYPRKSLKIHDNNADGEQTDTDNSIINCDYCNFQTSEPNMLTRHTNVFHNFNCETCYQKFKSPREVEDHMKSAHSVHNFPLLNCMDCPYRATSLSDLNDHIKSNHQIKCNLCKFQGEKFSL